jgi:perosamine synthetase
VKNYKAAFAEENIDARVFFYPLSSLDIFEAQPNNKYAWDIPANAINLPSYHDLTNNEQNRVIELIKRLL